MVKKMIEKGLKKRIGKVALWSAAANLGLMYLLFKQFDLVSYALYLSIAFICSLYLFQKRGGLDNQKFFILGSLISLKYHLLGLLLGWFAIDPVSIAIVAVQQGIITLIVGKVIKK